MAYKGSIFSTLLIVFFLLFKCEIFSQKVVNVDSLKLSVSVSKSDSLKLNTYLQIIDYYSNSNLDSALKYLYTAQEISSRDEKEPMHSKIKFLFGSIFYLKGDYYHSLDFFQQYLHINQNDTSKLSYQGACLSNIGNIYYLTKEYSQALVNYKIALNLFQKSKDIYFKKVKAAVINNIANIYDVRGQKDSAIITYRYGYNEALLSNDLENLSRIQNNLGDIFLELNQLDSAFFYLNSSLKIRKEKNDVYGLITSYKNLGLYYQKTKNPDIALDYYLKSNQLSKQLNELFSLNETSGQISELYAAKGDYKNAFRYYHDYKSTADSLFNEKMIKEITSLELNYRFEAEKQKKLAEENKRKANFIITVISLIFIIMLLTLLYFLSYSKNRRRKLENEKLQLEKDKIQLININLQQSLEIKNKELTTNVMYLVKKNEFLNSISKKLLVLKDSLKTENQLPLQQIIYELQRGSESDVWNEFEMLFQNVHLDFFKRLEEKFPDLSSYEKRLCAFIRLKMNSKEISALLHINLKSVIVARTRLRKKLNITNTEIDLENFFADI